MIEDFYTTPFTVLRPTWSTDIEGGFSYSELVAGTSFSGHLQQASAALVQSLGMSLTKTFTVWCPISTNVVEGDVIEADSIRYTVRAIMRNAIGDNAHLELVVELTEVTSDES